MKVKAGDKIHDGEDEPVMVILTETDIKNISNMGAGATSYACFPDSWKDKEKMWAWMRDAN